MRRCAVRPNPLPLGKLLGRSSVQLAENKDGNQITKTPINRQHAKVCRTPSKYTLQRTVLNDPPWTRLFYGQYGWKRAPGSLARAPLLLYPGPCIGISMPSFLAANFSSKKNSWGDLPSDASTSPPQHRYHLWLLLESTRYLVPERIRGGPGRLGRRGRRPAPAACCPLPPCRH